MAPTTERIFYLLTAYTSGNCTAAEERELLEWISQAPESEALEAYVKKLWQTRETGAGAANVDWNKMFCNIMRSDKVVSIADAPSRTAIGWRYMLTAASVVLMLLIGGAVYFLSIAEKTPAHVKANENGFHHNIASPELNKAVLKLANGKELVLDSALNGSLAQHGVYNARKLNANGLAYTPDKNASAELHTLQVPRGSQPVQLRLADGSQVWLNVGSSITFPTIFSGDNRKVTLTGEAYFEIAKDAGKKFLIEANGTTTEVLGTHFNINAYQNEPAVKVTLLEGLVKVKRSGKTVTLKPGHEATCSNESITLSNNIHAGEVLAWKTGVFEFADTDIQLVMRQIERWYNVEVVFADVVTQHFNGTITRQATVGQVLKMLEKTGGVRFAMEGKKIFVRKY